MASCFRAAGCGRRIAKGSPETITADEPTVDQEATSQVASDFQTATECSFQQTDPRNLETVLRELHNQQPEERLAANRQIPARIDGSKDQSKDQRSQVKVSQVHNSEQIPAYPEQRRITLPPSKSTAEKVSLATEVLPSHKLQREAEKSVPAAANRNLVFLTPEEEAEVINKLSKIELKGEGAEAIRAESLWQEGVALLLLLRRPGCVTCRAESLKLESIAPELDQLGVRRVAIVHEWLGNEIKAYTRGFWSGQVYLDPHKEFFKVLGGGEVRQGKMAGFVNPKSQLWKNIAAAKVVMKGLPFNFKGDFTTLGGLIIVRPGSKGVQYMFREQIFGDPLDPEQILQQCSLAAGIPRLSRLRMSSLSSADVSHRFSLSSRPSLPLSPAGWSDVRSKLTKSSSDVEGAACAMCVGSRNNSASSNSGGLEAFGRQ